MNDMPALQPGIRTLSDQLWSGTLSSRQLVEQCLSVIDQREPEIRAWVRVDRDGALSQADGLDQELRAGQSRGPLHGIPIAIKDIIDVAGFTTAAGSTRLASAPPAVFDAPIVTALRAAGCVILGKTVTTQFACFDPPPTRNPWKLDRTPGGSSSGSAAAVAAGMCVAAIGSQTGGSITRPAAFCGVAGCKPTWDTVPLEGIVPLAPSMDHPGPLARCVEDLSILLSVLRGDFTSGLLQASGTGPGPTLARVRDFMSDKVEPAMTRALDRAVERLQRAGARVIEIDPPAGFADILTHHRAIMTSEAGAWHRDAFQAHRDDYGPCIGGLIEEGLRTPAVDYLRAREQQRDARDRMRALFQSEPIDALLTPAATGGAPDAATTGNPCMNAPWSFTGQPTVSFAFARDDDGLPLALQLAGAMHADNTLLEVAGWCESVLRAS